MYVYKLCIFNKVDVLMAEKEYTRIKTLTEELDQDEIRLGLPEGWTIQISRYWKA